MNIKLLGDNIFDHLINLRNGKSDMRSYFHWKSPVWRAIQCYFNETKERWVNLIGEHPDKILVTHPGTGADVTIKNAYIDWHKNDIMVLEIFVSFCDDNCNNETVEMFTLHVPKDLELNFTQEKFDSWATEVANKRNEDIEKKEKATLLRLLDKYPEFRGNV